MMAERNINGRAMRYRPVSECGLTNEQRERAYEASDKAMRIAEATRRLVMAAGKDVDGFEGLAQWYVATVKPGQERIACDDMAQSNIEFWCPEAIERRPPKRGRTVTNIHRPIFHGYVFVRLVASLAAPEAWAGVMVAARVGGWLGVDGVPLALPDRFIKELKINVKRPEIAKRLATIKPGMKGDVADGPFASFRATVLRVTGGGKRVKTEIDIFGQATLVELALDQLKF